MAIELNEKKWDAHATAAGDAMRNLRRTYPLAACCDICFVPVAMRYGQIHIMRYGAGPTLIGRLLGRYFLGGS